MTHKKSPKYKSISLKIILYSVTMVCTCTLIGMLTLYWVIKNELLDSRKSEYEIVLQEVVQELNIHQSTIEKVAQYIVVDKCVSDYLFSKLNKKLDYNHFLLENEVQALLHTMIILQDVLVEDIYIIDSSGDVIRSNEYVINKAYDKEWYEQYRDYNGIFYDEGVYYTHSIYNPSLGDVGKVVILINEEYLFKSANTINVEQCNIYFENSNGDIIFGKSNEGDTSETILETKILSSNLTMFAELDLDILEEGVKQIQYILYGILAINICFACAVLIPMLRKLLYPLIELSGVIRKFPKDLKECELINTQNDEVGIIIKEYSQMTKRIKHLIAQLKLQRKMELKLYMARIHPHLVYNTLNTIAQRAESCNEPQIAKDIKVLTDILYCSMHSELEQTHSIDQEIQYSEKYVDILRGKYGAALRIDWNVPESLYKEQIGILLLYPIIENAVFHGTVMSDEKNITVTMEGFVDYINVMIQDNGGGMKQEKIAEVMSRVEKWIHILDGDIEDDVDLGAEIAHLGIVSVALRLRLLYGGESRLMIKSHIGSGTEVSFKIINKKRLEGEHEDASKIFLPNG